MTAETVLSVLNHEETQMAQPSVKQIVTLLETDSNPNQSFDTSRFQLCNSGYA